MGRSRRLSLELGSPRWNRELDHQVGYVLEIDAFGHPGFGIDVNGVWQHLTSGPKKLDRPRNANIQLVNLKSHYKPFEIVNPAGGVRWDVYGGERSYSMFEWWNHWPVSQIASSGRPAIAADRPSHTSLSDIYWGDYKHTEHTETKILMTGLTGARQ